MFAFFRARKKSKPRFARDRRIGRASLAFSDCLRMDAEQRGDAFLRAALFALGLILLGAHSATA